MMVTAFDLLLKYATNLLGSKRPPKWRTIAVNSGNFKARIDCMNGARDILKLIGYCEETQTSMNFPEAVPEPDRWKVSSIAAELLMAKVGVEQIIRGKGAQDITELRQPHSHLLRSVPQGPLPSTYQEPLPPTYQGPLPSTYQGPLPSTYQGPLPSTYQGPLPSTYQGPLPPTYQGPLPSTYQGPLPPINEERWSCLDPQDPLHQAHHDLGTPHPLATPPLKTPSLPGQSSVLRSSVVPPSRQGKNALCLKFFLTAMICLSTSGPVAKPRRNTSFIGDASEKNL